MSSFTLSQLPCIACVTDPSHFQCTTCKPVPLSVIQSQVWYSPVGAAIAQRVRDQASSTACAECHRELNPNDPPLPQRPGVRVCMDCRKKCKRCRRTLITSELKSSSGCVYAVKHCLSCREELSYRL
jgi:hypothetical protein